MRYRTSAGDKEEYEIQNEREIANRAQAQSHAYSDAVRILWSFSSVQFSVIFKPLHIFFTLFAIMGIPMIMNAFKSPGKPVNRHPVVQYSNIRVNMSRDAGHPGHESTPAIPSIEIIRTY